jgi:hypothetical protein
VLHNMELHYLYSSPNIIRQVKSKGMKWGEARGTLDRGEERVQGFGGKA